MGEEGKHIKNPNYDRVRLYDIKKFFSFLRRRAKRESFEIAVERGENRDVNLHVNSDLKCTGCASRLGSILDYFSKDCDTFRIHFDERYEVDLSVPVQILAFANRYSGKEVHILGESEKLREILYVNRLVEASRGLENLHAPFYLNPREEDEGLEGEVLSGIFAQVSRARGR